MWMKSEEDKKLEDKEHPRIHRDMPVLVIVDKKTGMIASHVAMKKGTHGHAIKMLRIVI